MEDKFRQLLCLLLPKTNNRYNINTLIPAECGVIRTFFITNQLSSRFTCNDNKNKKPRRHTA